MARGRRGGRSPLARALVLDGACVRSAETTPGSLGDRSQTSEDLLAVSLSGFSESLGFSSWVGFWEGQGAGGRPRGPSPPFRCRSHTYRPPCAPAWLPGTPQARCWPGPESAFAATSRRLPRHSRAPEGNRSDNSRPCPNPAASPRPCTIPQPATSVPQPGDPGH